MELYKCKENFEIENSGKTISFVNGKIYEGDENFITNGNENIPFLRFTEGTAYSINAIKNKLFEKLINEHYFNRGDLVEFNNGKKAVVREVNNFGLIVNYLDNATKQIDENEVSYIPSSLVKLAYKPATTNGLTFFGQRKHRLRKSEIKPFMVVEMRNGMLMIAVLTSNGIAFENKKSVGGDLLFLSAYNYSLENRQDEGFDIMNVYGLTANPRAAFILSRKNRPVIWERETGSTITNLIPDFEKKEIS